MREGSMDENSVADKHEGNRTRKKYHDWLVVAGTRIALILGFIEDFYM